MDATESELDLARAFDAHARALLRYCACRVGPDVAEDVVAQTFLVAHSRRADFDPARATVSTWLYGIATQLLRGHRRAESRRLAGLAKAAQSDVDTDFADGAAARVDAQAMHRRVAEAMAALPMRQRDVLLLIALADLDYAQVAAALDIPIGTVRSALHRARTRLRTALMTGEDHE